MDTSLFERYSQELENELELNEATVRNVQMKLPGIRHKWVGRLIRHKYEIATLKQKRHQAKQEIVQQIRSSEPITVSDASVNKMAEAHEIIRKIDSKIEELELIVDYLERVEVVCRNATFDIKNLVEILKMETM